MIGFGPAAERGGQPAAAPSCSAVEGRARAARGRISFVERRRVDDAGDRAPVDNQGGRHRPARIADYESAGAVDRVDHEETSARQPLEIVDGLLREPTRLRQRLPQAALQQRIGGEIGVRHRRAADFRFDLRGGARSQPEIFEAPDAPASRAAEASKSRAAAASMSASTLKGGMSVAVEGSRLGFSREDRGAQSQRRKNR